MYESWHVQLMQTKTPSVWHSIEKRGKGSIFPLKTIILQVDGDLWSESKVSLVWRGRWNIEQCRGKRCVQWLTGQEWMQNERRRTRIQHWHRICSRQWKSRECIRTPRWKKTPRKKKWSPSRGMSASLGQNTNTHGTPAPFPRQGARARVRPVPTSFLDIGTH